MKIRISSIPIMLEYLTKPNTESSSIDLVRNIFEHEDYMFEVKRYGLPSVENLVSYFSRLKSIQADDIPDLSDERKKALRDKHNLWLDCAFNPQKYYNRYEKLKNILCEDNIQNLQHKLSDAFPNVLELKQCLSVFITRLKLSNTSIKLIVGILFQKNNWTGIENSVTTL